MISLIRMALLVPRNVAVAVLHAYRTVVSPLYGDVCRYYPSCSAYAVGSIQQRGVIMGAVLSARRLARCHPWASGGVDEVHGHPRHPVAVNRFGFVVAETHGKA